MKSPAIARIIASTVFAFAVVSCAGQKGRQAADLSGTYRKDKSNELLILRQDPYDFSREAVPFGNSGCPSGDRARPFEK